MQAGISDADGSADFRFAISTGHCRLHWVCSWQQGAQQVPAACQRLALDGLHTAAACCRDSSRVLLFGSWSAHMGVQTAGCFHDLSRAAACCEHWLLCLLSATIMLRSGSEGGWPRPVCWWPSCILPAELLLQKRGLASCTDSGRPGARHVPGMCCLASCTSDTGSRVLYSSCTSDTGSRALYFCPPGPCPAPQLCRPQSVGPGRWP